MKKHWMVAMALVSGLAFGMESGTHAYMAGKGAAYSLDASGEITIDAQGNVGSYRLETDKIPPSLLEILDGGIKKWRFEPILIDGRPVNARTSMHLRIDVEPNEDAYRLRLTNVSFGAPTRQTSDLKPPKYPELAQRAGIEARVVLVLELNAEGKVVNAEAEQTSLSGTGRDRVVQEWREIFEENARTAARHWKFKIEEIIGGEAQRMSRVRMPVEYRLGDESHWLALIPVKKPARPFQKVVSAPNSLRSGEVQPLTSNFKLKNQVVGEYL